MVPSVGIKQSRSPGWKPKDEDPSDQITFGRNQTIPLAGMNLFIRCPFPNFPKLLDKSADSYDILTLRTVRQAGVCAMEISIKIGSYDERYRIA